MPGYQQLGGGAARLFLEPESVAELKDTCAEFFRKGLAFDLIGHTSNTYFVPGYNVERMVSTRKVNHFEIREDSVYCECGTSVRQLSIAFAEEGITGLEGCIDLPGTVAAAIVGHATCYGSDISQLLVSAEVLTSDGQVQTVSPDWFGFSKRSSVLKRGEKTGVILSVTLRKQLGDKQQIKALTEHNHATRKATQPEPKNSLGSIFAEQGKPSTLNHILKAISKLYDIVLRIVGNDFDTRQRKRKHLTFALLGATDVEPYVRAWNWYQWRDERSHALFWKYVRLHQRMFTRSDFEIIIKGNP